MPRRHEAKRRGEMRRCLARWREVVEGYARGRRGDPGMYAGLHGELLLRCRALSEECGEEHKALCEEVEKLVRPWLSSAALIQAKQDILLEMLQRCRQAERRLGRPSWLEVGRQWLRPALATVMGGTVLGVLVWATVRWWLPLRSLFKGTRYEIRIALERLGTSERWMLGGAIAIVLAMVVLSRTAKS